MINEEIATVHLSHSYTHIQTNLKPLLRSNYAFLVSLFHKNQQAYLRIV